MKATTFSSCLAAQYITTQSLRQATSAPGCQSSSGLNSLLYTRMGFLAGNHEEGIHKRCTATIGILRQKKSMKCPMEEILRNPRKSSEPCMGVEPWNVIIFPCRSSFRSPGINSLPSICPNSNISVHNSGRHARTYVCSPPGVVVRVSCNRKILVID